MSKFKTWEEVRKDLNFTPEEEEQIRFEEELIEATIKAREEAHLTQEELSKKSGVKQPAIAKLEFRLTGKNEQLFSIQGVDNTNVFVIHAD